MKEPKEILKNLNIDNTWTLFLDRDGVINKKIENDYVRNWEQFEFLPNVIEALKILNTFFGRIIIVTNQRGIGRGFMSENDLENIHNRMINILKKGGIKIDAIYYCPHDYEKQDCNCRKPKIGMALEAKVEFPEINFRKSIMVGDSISDMGFAFNSGMIGVYLSKNKINKLNDIYTFDNLYEFANCIKEHCT